MNKKKNILISLASVALLSLGLATVSSPASASTHAELTHNAYVYNVHGIKARRASLKRGKRIVILGKKTIHGKKYIKIGKNQYVKAANLAKDKASAVSSGKLIHNAFIYNLNGKRVGKKSLKKNQVVSILGTKTIHGKKYYRIGKNQYVKVANIGDLSSSNNTDKTTNGVNKSNSDSGSKSSDSNSNDLNNSTKANNFSKSNSNFAKSNDATKKDDSTKNNDSKSNDFAEPQDMVIQQNCWVCDVNGAHILGSFGHPRQSVQVIGKQTINGLDYYKVSYPRDSSHYVYVKVTAFSKGDNQNLPTPANYQELIKFQNYTNKKHHIEDSQLYGLSSPQVRDDYDSAIGTAYAVANSVFSTSNEIAQAKALVENAEKKLNGKGVEVPCAHWQWYENNYKLTPTEKADICKVAEKALGISKINFVENSNQQMFYRLNDTLETINAEQYIDFKK